AGYHYLVNSLGIPESNIVLGGDSAGANLAAAFLLHLARPNPLIKVPESLGSTPKRPAGALLISPYTNLFGSTKKFYENAPFDIISPNLIGRAAFAYIGAKFPAKFQLRHHGWNPLYLLFPTQKPLPEAAHRLPDLYGWSDVKHIKLFQDPYVNPFVCNDASWWKEACPGDGKTLISWGGKEIFVDDDQALYDQLEKAGVEPVKVYHPLKLHDWLLHDYGLVLSSRVRQLGNELDDFHYGLKQTVKFIAHVIDEASAPSQPRLAEGSTSATNDRKGDSSKGLRNRSGGNSEAPEADYSNEALATAVDGLRKAEKREASVGASADYSNEAVITASVGLRSAERQAEQEAGAAAPSSREGGEVNTSTGATSSKKTTKVASSATAPPKDDKKTSTSSPAPKEQAAASESKKASAPAPDTDGGSYATIAAHHDHIAQNAPIVAEGEGDTIKTSTDTPEPSKHAEKQKEDKLSEPKKKAVEPIAASSQASTGGASSKSKKTGAKPAQKEPASTKQTVAFPAISGGKAEQPKPSTNGGGSYAAIAADHDHIASNAPIVAEGEGDVIHPSQA
ncbi:hypothetical protein JCM10908_000750, partial [Rhodotorula pacifica]|uniref:uncharacterized protein n=1 Tax=Rhodotorula pacifica TaxID=1495444 RepID=UPI00316F1975